MGGDDVGRRSWTSETCFLEMMGIRARDQADDGSGGGDVEQANREGGMLIDCDKGLS